MTNEPLPDSIYATLRARIIAHEFAPGVSVTESAIASDFGVARPTAKMAIERLVNEGLLHRETNAAARVPQLDAADIVDLFNNRSVIEETAVAALSLSATVSPAAVLAHRALLADAATGRPFAEHDIEFHRALVDSQPSPRLAKMHALLMGEIELCIGQVQAEHLMDPEDVATQHQAILDAIIAGHADSAADRMREHIRQSRDSLLAFHSKKRPHPESTKP